MSFTNKELKQRHFDKVYKNAPMIPCACGCGIMIKSKDKYARDNKYVNGHNGRIHPIGHDPRRYFHVNTVKANKRLMKSTWLKKKGGSCEMCDVKYNNKNAVMFDFHHTRDKLYGISSFTYKTDPVKIQTEMDKCIILCANCHRIIHNDEW